jgi:hypothetical protein
MGVRFVIYLLPLRRGRVYEGKVVRIVMLNGSVGWVVGGWIVVRRTMRVGLVDVLRALKISAKRSWSVWGDRLIHVYEFCRKVDRVTSRAPNALRVG